MNDDPANPFIVFPYPGEYAWLAVEPVAGGQAPRRVPVAIIAYRPDSGKALIARPCAVPGRGVTLNMISFVDTKRLSFSNDN